MPPLRAERLSSPHLSAEARHPTVDPGDQVRPKVRTAKSRASVREPTTEQTEESVSEVGLSEDEENV